MKNSHENIRCIISEGVKNQKIIVIGDIMLDKYYYGEVKRISPEAPVPVVGIKKEKQVLGGAANVASNLKNIGCIVELFGVVGNDANKDNLAALLKERDIVFTAFTSDERQTVTKTRIIGLNQQMLRLDFEDTIPIGEKIENEIIDYFGRTINDAVKTVIISDYGKGTCTPKVCRDIILKCKAKGITTIIDPKGVDWSKYEGAEFITPNTKELGDIIGETVINEDTTIEKIGTKIKNEYNIGNLIVTRSEKGMTLINNDEIVHIPTVAKEVFDVSGAGDTVVATLAAFLSTGLNVVDSLELANISAGFVVSKAGTYAIHNDELMAAFNDIYDDVNANKKIFSNTEVMVLVDKLKANNKVCVFTNGCFDILHMGHLSYLQQAKALGDVLIVGLNSDESVKRLKGESRPINNQIARANMLAALHFIDYVVVFEEDTPKELIKLISPNILVKGGDYKIEDIVGREYADKVEVIPFLEGYSTTKIINEIQRKN